MKISIFTAFLLSYCLMGSIAAADSWSQKADFPGTAGNFDPLYFSIGNKGYVGIVGSSKFWEYDPSLNSWIQKANLPPNANTFMTSFVIGDHAYLVIGVAVWQYDPNTNKWTQKNDVPGADKTGAFGFSVGNKGYVGGGAYGKNDFYEYDADSDQWTKKNGIPKTSDYYNADEYYSFDDVTFSIGSKGYVTGTNAGLWEYDPSTDTWTKKLNYYWEINANHAATFSIEQKGYIFNRSGEMWEYDPVSNLLTLKSPFPGTKVCGGMAGFSLNGNAYVGLGSIMSNNTCTLTKSSQLWEYSPSFETGSFAFDTVNSPVPAAACFPVRVEARTASNTLDTTFSGEVSLATNYGGVSPTTLSFSNGVASNNCVNIYGDGESKQLSVQGQGRLGQSNYFSTTNAGSCFGRIEITTGAGATVELYNITTGHKIAQNDVNIFNVAVFDTIPCGSYITVVGKDEYWHRDNSLLNVEYSGSTYTRNIPFPSAGTKKRAVILIPGMLGSTHRGVPIAAAPYLKGNFPDKDLVINSPTITGWNRLQSGLEADGYTVITCPWDWRSESKESMKKNVENFLIPAIDNAKQYSSDGKVDIVAHSMGGLLARAYIQSDLYKNRKDVEKLALVAVPNQGSANPYFLWEGGDTKTTKKVLDTKWDKILGNTYVETIQNLWQKTYHKNNWHACDAIHIKELLDKYGPGMLQLMSTEKFLTKNGKAYSVAASGNVNTWLKALNNGSSGFANPGDVFSHTDNQKVLTRVFLGNISSSTLRGIGVGAGAGSLYPDGKPEGAGSLDCSDTEPTGWSMLKGAGDTTVPLESAQYPVAQGWADRAEKISLVAHATIVKDFRDEIINFLNGEAGTTELESESQAKIATAKALMGEEVTPALAFSVIGNMRLLVTDSQGRRSGIVPGTSEVVNEIPEVNIEANDAVASVMIENPVDGEYNLTYYGPNDGDFFLAVSAYNSAGDGVEKSFRGYRPDSAQTMTVSYNPATSEQIIVSPIVLAPQEMETVPYTCGTGKCVRLRWKASENAGVTEYVVYRSLAEEPFYTELARVTNGVSSYDTGDVWDGASSFPVNGYAVSAIKTDTKESFFAEEKGVMKKPFPWTMFLPAIMGAKK